MSLAVALVLLASATRGLVPSPCARTRNLFNPTHDADDHGGEPWSVRRAVISLAAAGVAVGVMLEILVGSISEASVVIGLSPFFVGIIVVAIVGNAAEHWVAIYFAARDKMDLAVNIAIGSSAADRPLRRAGAGAVVAARRPIRWRWCSTGTSSARSSWRS